MGLAKYKCHKIVEAGKIRTIQVMAGDLSAVLEVEGAASTAVDRDWMKRHDPQIGGYYVAYKDGYQSYSPAKAFEEGYTKVENMMREKVLVENGNPRFSSICLFLVSGKTFTFKNVEVLHDNQSSIRFRYDAMSDGKTKVGYFEKTLVAGYSFCD